MADLLHQAVEQAHVGFGIADSGGAITYTNPRLAEILGRADLIGLTLHELGLGPTCGAGPTNA